MPERKIIKRFEIHGDPVKDIDGTELPSLELRKPTRARQSGR